MFALRMNGAVGPTSRVDGQYNSFVLEQKGKMHFKGKRKRVAQRQTFTHLFLVCVVGGS